MMFTSASQQAWLGFLFYLSLDLSLALAKSETSSKLSLTTFTTFPTESIASLTKTAITTETHTVITTGGKTATVPVLPEFNHGCWFCPTGFGGFVLSGFTKPGIYPSHTVSGFPTTFPEIAVDADGNPSFPARPTNTLNGTIAPTTGPKISRSNTTAPVTASFMNSTNIISIRTSAKTTSSTTRAKTTYTTTDTTTTDRRITKTKTTNSKTTDTETTDTESSNTRTRHTSINSTTVDPGNTDTRSTDTRTTDRSVTNSKTTDTKTTNTRTTSVITSNSLSSIAFFPTETPKTVTDRTIKSDSKTTETSGGHTTILPVLPIWGKGSGLCWFCPHIGGGFVLSGFLKPGVYPTGNLPGFPDIVPEITIGPDLIPTFSAEPTDKPTNNPTTSVHTTERTTTSKSDHTTSSSSACSKATVSNCKVITSFTVSGSTTETKVTTSCSTQTACSAHDTTSASATTTTAGGCWQYNYAIGEDDTEGDSSAKKRNDLDESGHRAHWLARRGSAEKYEGPSNCKLATAGNDKVTLPAYPSAGNLQKFPSASWWFVPTTVKEANQPCSILTMTQFENYASLRKQPVMTNLMGGQGIYTDKAGKKDKNGNLLPYVNVDHVYELSLIQDFLNSMVDSHAFQCNDFNSFFLAKDPSHNNAYRIQVILDQLPSNQQDYAQFAGMDAGINDIKGKMFNENLLNIPKPNAKKGDLNAQAVQIANQMAAAVDFVHQANIAKLFVNVNSRVYNAWKGIDALIAAGGCGAAPIPNGGKWADAYSTWATDWINARNSEITAKIEGLIHTDDNSPASFKNGVEAFLAKYPQPSWGWKEGVLFDWTVNSPLNINKRDGDSAVCSVSTTGTRASSVPASTTKETSTVKTTPTGKSTLTPISKTTIATSTKSTSSKPTTTSTGSTKTSEQTIKTTSKSSHVSTTVKSTPIASTVPTSTSSTGGLGVTACSGNQIAGSCTMASLPSATPDSGILSPVCNKVDANGYDFVRINSDKAQSAATTYCQNLVSGKTVLNAQNTAPKPGTESGACEKGGTLSLTIIFDVDSCNAGTSTGNQQVDFAAMGVETCVQNLYTVFSEACAQDSTWGDYNPDYTLEGGTWGNSCALWSLSGET